MAGSITNALATSDGADSPYVSVVVTTRNDDHGGDPLKRLQAFVNCFEEQCRRTGLDAEVIIVEWNPPVDRPKLNTLLRLPNPCFCSYRFIEVPPEVHGRLRHADVLPLFQMIAKNVGIRRARGRFVLATNIDIIFSTGLIEHIASGRLQPGYLYRVDRHDIQSEFPVEASLEAQMDYCASHQLRLHTRRGSFPVDSSGRAVSLPEDIVDGRTVVLGEGWHVRERGDASLVYRWASDRAELTLDTGPLGVEAGAVLELEVESNPYTRSSWVELVATEGQSELGRGRIVGRRRLELPLTGDARGNVRCIELRVTDANPDWRRELPAFERRDTMRYRVFSLKLRPPSHVFEYPADRWIRANVSSGLTLDSAPDGVLVGSEPRKWSYCVRYGPLQAPRRDIYTFDLAYTVLDGGINLGVLSGDDRFWIPSRVTAHDDMRFQRVEIAAELAQGQQFWLVVSNNHPDGDARSRFVVHRLDGSVSPTETAIRSIDGSGIDPAPVSERGSAAAALSEKPEPSGPVRRRISALADTIVAAIAANLGERLRSRIVQSAPELHAWQEAFRASQQQLQEIAHASELQAQELAALRDLRELSDFHRFLHDRRPDDLHLNGCGDFQLMAREHWHDLRGYPEFETFSMNIDGLFSHTACAAGIAEQMLDMPIYHLEHEVGSGWSPEGEALLRRRIAERGITWLDATAVHIWASYMRWLQRPAIFNDSHWGFGDVALPDSVHSAIADVTTHHVRDRR